MQKPNINTAKSVTPMIYAYTTPEIARHDGWTKIGYTEQDVETRIKQQTHTADVRWNLEWKGNALFDDGSGERFTDKEFHAYLRKSGIEQVMDETLQGKKCKTKLRSINQVIVNHVLIHNL